MTGQLAPNLHMTAKPIAKEFTGFFEPPSVGMPNPYSGGGGGSPFSGIEGLLMNYAMEDAMGSAQQNAKQKVGGVMSGIQSLVSEAFPNFSGGMGSGTVGGGFNPPNQITQPTSPAPFVSESVTQPTGPSPSTPLSGDPTAPLLGGGGFNPDGGVPVTGKAPYTPQIGFGGDPNAPQMDYTPEQIGNLLSQTPQSNPMAGGPPVGLKNFLTSIQNKTPLSMGGPPPVDPSSVGLGGNPMILQPPMTDPTTIYNPAMEYNPAINYNVIKPATLDPSDPASPEYNPAMEYNPVFPMPQLPQQDPLINLAYNYNMENSPF